jgi:hypothetical protein
MEESQMTNDKEVIFETIRARLNKALERWYQGDPFGWLELADEEMTYFSPFMNSRLDGKSAVVANIAPAEGQIHSPQFEIHNPDLQLGEDMAALTYQLRELDEDDHLTAGWKVSDIYRQADSGWRLIHTHISPFGEEG